MRATTAATTEHLIRYGGEFTDLVIERADGVWLRTEDGRRILDFTSGQMCATLGHGHPAILDAIRQASGRVVHLFRGFRARECLGVGPGADDRAARAAGPSHVPVHRGGGER